MDQEKHAGKISVKSPVVSIMGLGYVGLPLGIAFVKAGWPGQRL